MKDFYDIWLLSRQFVFDGLLLSEATRQTFSHRQTDVPEHPVAFSERFYRDPAKAALWKSFIRKSLLNHAPQSLEDVVLAVSMFLAPLVEMLANARPFKKHWEAGGPWRS
jgi:hypothetical protein